MKKKGILRVENVEALNFQNLMPLDLKNLEN